MKKEKLVCIGNSITNGFPFKRSQSFPSLIREATGWEVINKGVNGETTEQVLFRFSKDVLAHNPDRVAILTGTNDFIFEVDTVKGASEKLKQMVGLAHQANIQVLLMTPLLTLPKMAREAWMSTANVDYDGVNGQLKELGRELLQYGEGFDFQKLFCLDLASHYEIYMKKTSANQAYHDGLHPTVEGHCFLAQLILENWINIR
jgi:lysophospholipase L1-like esterase